MGAPLPPPDLKDELATLAHEYGHYRSFSERTPRDEWNRYHETELKRSASLRGIEGDAAQRAALSDALDAEDRDLIMREEALAWTIGREVLAELGVTDEAFFAFYDGRTRKGLHNHRYRLSMDELWPEDVGGG